MIIGYSALRGKPKFITAPLTKRVRRNLLRAYIRMSPLIYASGIVFWTTILTLISLTIVELTILLTEITFSTQLRLLTLLAAPLTFFSTLYFYPHYVAGSIKRHMERSLAYTVGCMFILTSAEAGIEQIIGFLAEEGGLFGVKEYARNVLRDVSLLGLDVITAINEEASRCPSARFREFVQGYITTLKNGGNMRHYLESSFKRIVESRRLYLTKLIDTLNILAEIYIIVLVVFPVIIVTMLSLIGLVGGAVLGFIDPVTLIRLIIYFIIPVAAMASLLVLDMVLSGW